MLPDVPKRCTLCLLYDADKPQDGCQVCMDQAMAQSFLCDLVRSAGADNPSFTCHAFRPNLSLVGEKQPKEKTIAVCQDKVAYFSEVVQMMQSGRCGGGCSKGNCHSSPQRGGSVRKYHVVLSVQKRKPLFAQSDRYLPFLHDLFLSCGRLMTGRILLLWLATDHLHLYLECPDKEPAVEIVEDLQGFVYDALIQEYSKLRKEYATNMIWAKEFFLEEINET